jgi:exodeoxyribonuclease VII large subunit
MSDLIDDPEPGQNSPEFSVSEISGAVKRMIEGEFSRVRIKGEVGRVSRPRSGHIYLDLKDDKSVLGSVIWKGVSARLRTQPEEGMEVVATGKLTTFPGQSKYQLVIDDIAPAGMGALMAMLEKRKQALAAEGLFDMDRKKPIPFLPEVIGVVTSPSGAVIRDILHRLRDRFPRKVLVWPVAVQGEKCAAEVSAAIAGFNAFKSNARPDLIIVARGGGSIEDLWGFNEEAVVRAIAASDIPVISAVGHETDTTLSDFVSDQRAPTPTAAAELAVPVRSELMGGLASLDERRIRALGIGIQNRSQRLRDLARALPNPAEIVALQGQRLDMLSGRLPLALSNRVGRSRGVLGEKSAGLRPIVLKNAVSQRRDVLARVFDGFIKVSSTRTREQRNKLEALDRLRSTLGYKATLARGYAVVRDDQGNLVTTKALAKKADALEIEFADGRVSSGTGAIKGKPKAKPTPKGTDQGSLF